MMNIDSKPILKEHSRLLAHRKSSSHRKQNRDGLKNIVSGHRNGKDLRDGDGHVSKASRAGDKSLGSRV